MGEENIKIFPYDREVDKAGAENTDIDRGAKKREEITRQVILGNMQRARNLGKTIAESFKNAAEREELACIAKSCSIVPDRAIKDQAITLCVFAAEYCLDRFMESDALASAAESKLYDKLLEDSPSLYNALLSSASFSFYYMNLDKEADPKKIGETFAMLCSDRDSKNLACYGEAIFNTVMKEYKGYIESAGFRK